MHQATFVLVLGNCLSTLVQFGLGQSSTFDCFNMSQTTTPSSLLLTTTNETDNYPAFLLYSTTPYPVPTGIRQIGQRCDVAGVANQCGKNAKCVKPSSFCNMGYCGCISDDYTVELDVDGNATDCVEQTRHLSNRTESFYWYLGYLDECDDDYYTLPACNDDLGLSCQRVEAWGNATSAAFQNVTTGKRCGCTPGQVYFNDTGCSSVAEFGAPCDTSEQCRFAIVYGINPEFYNTYNEFWDLGNQGYGVSDNIDFFMGYCNATRQCDCPPLLKPVFTIDEMDLPDGTVTLGTFCVPATFTSKGHEGQYCTVISPDLVLEQYRARRCHTGLFCAHCPEDGPDFTIGKCYNVTDDLDPYRHHYLTRSTPLTTTALALTTTTPDIK